jgi:hypothetical protein
MVQLSTRAYSIQPSNPSQTRRYENFFAQQLNRQVPTNLIWSSSSSVGVPPRVKVSRVERQRGGQSEGLISRLSIRSGRTTVGPWLMTFRCHVRPMTRDVRCLRQLTRRVYCRTGQSHGTIIRPDESHPDVSSDVLPSEPLP